jgi:hypothetical protein
VKNRGKIMKIANVKGLYFEIPNKVWYSFFNSPYQGHRLGSAIDVYYHENAIFPFEEGVVREIRKIRTPSLDYLIIIKVNEFCLKVLHVKPTVKIGETLYRGDEFGELITSGFFYPWSDKHAHFEVRDCGDRYRVRGGYPLRPLYPKLVPSAIGDEFEVIEKKEKYCWLRSVSTGRKNLTPLAYQNTSIEGGLPHYGYGVVFGNLDRIEIFGIELKTNPFTKIFEANFEVFANDCKIKGIGVYCNQEKIKLIGGEFEEGDILKLRFMSCSDYLNRV